ncbi:MAG: hypothetical protein ACLP50_29340 [Solirubrobacteraceae bacterium]
MSQRIGDSPAGHVATTEPEQLRRGRELARKRRHREANIRVREFQRWLSRGCPRHDLPRMPSAADWRIVRGGR